MTIPSDPPDSPPDLEVIAGELADVEAALGRLQSGDYWTDEVTGAALPEALLTADPLIRRLPTTA